MRSLRVVGTFLVLLTPLRSVAGAAACWQQLRASAAECAMGPTTDRMDDMAARTATLGGRKHAPSPAAPGACTFASVCAASAPAVVTALVAVAAVTPTLPTTFPAPAPVFASGFLSPPFHPPIA